MRRVLPLVSVVALTFWVAWAVQAQRTQRPMRPKTMRPTLPAQAAWHQAASAGVQWRQLRWPDGNGGHVRVTVVRAPARRFRIATGATLDAAAWRRRTGAVAAANGGYFDTSGRSLGLRISGGVRRQRMHLKRWGVFYVVNDRAHIVDAENYANATRGRKVQEAVQCGPVLVHNGRRRKLRPQSARRTALGIDRQGRVILAVADGWMTFDAWSGVWAAQNGLNCRHALNLDGGGSTQLSLRTQVAELEVDGATGVPDAVIVR